MNMMSTWPSQHGYVILVLMILSTFPCHSLDLCSVGDAEQGLRNPGHVDLSNFIHTHSIPRALKKAGQFVRVSDVQDWIDCVVVCCMQENCDVAFYFQETCYMIKCDPREPDGCQPVERSQLNSTLVIVRQPGSPSHPTTTSVEGQPCEYGMQQCGQNEECLHQGPASSKSRSGVCVCRHHYQRNSQGVCQPAGHSMSPDFVPEVDQEDLPADGAGHSGQPAVTKLTVSAGEHKVLQLPDNSITLSAFVLPKANKDEEYHYEWSPVVQPAGSEERATMQGKNTNTLKLSNLIAGLYRLKVQVTGENKFGEAFVNVSVLPPKRQNKPPVAVITPTSQRVKSENSFILDGSDSTDDDGIRAYHWEEVSGPLQEHDIDGDSQTLKLKDMAPGEYVFRLTVTDTDGATNSTSAKVTVVKEKDYPPKANAGSDMIIHLPQKWVLLCGNASSDDKAIVSYEWIKKSDSLTADMAGVRSECLRLNNLEVGDYTFTLKVVDSGGNVGTADVHVYVKPETNHPPVARTAGEVVVRLPSHNIVLDGQKSTDDTGVVAYTWTQTGGPNTLTLTHTDQPVAMATGEIQAGYYEFKLTVSDAEEQTSSDKLRVHVVTNDNSGPVARAGGERVVLLPVTLVALDGSASSDDQGITSYLWQRHGTSLAAGDVVNNSDHQAVLQLVNLVAGHYSFTLTVVDEQGLTSQDTASLLVKNGDDFKDLVELVLDTDIHYFTEDDEISVVKQLELLVRESSQYSGSMVQVQSIEQELTKGHVRLTFFVRMKGGPVISGLDIVHLLRDKLDNYIILRFSIISLDTVLCQNNCSGHGECDLRSRTCNCDSFWMPNVIKMVYRQESNCEWSILYVVIICFGVVVGIIIGIWLILCCCHSKRCRIKTKKQHRYRLIGGEEDDDEAKSAMLPKGKIQNSSVMMSESDFTSEEETLFAKNKRVNGFKKPSNGVATLPSQRSKLTT